MPPNDDQKTEIYERTRKKKIASNAETVRNANRNQNYAKCDEKGRGTRNADGVQKKNYREWKRWLEGVRAVDGLGWRGYVWS